MNKIESDILFNLEMKEAINVSPLEPNEYIENFTFKVEDFVDDSEIGLIKIRALSLYKEVDLWNMADADSGELAAMVSQLVDEETGEFFEKFTQGDDKSISHIFYIDAVRMNAKYEETNVAKVAVIAALNHLLIRLDASDRDIFSVPIVWSTGKTFFWENGKKSKCDSKDFGLMKNEAINTREGFSIVTSMPEIELDYSKSYEKTEAFHERFELSKKVVKTPQAKKQMLKV